MRLRFRGIGLPTDGEIAVEAVLEREEFAAIAEMPFADGHGGVTAIAQRFGQSDLFSRDAGGSVGAEDVDDADAEGLSAGEECGARGAANDVGDVILGEAHAAVSQSIDDGGFDLEMAVDAEVAIGEVVGPYPDDVGRVLSCLLSCLLSRLLSRLLSGTAWCGRTGGQ